MASVSGGTIEDVLSAVNSSDFEDIVGPLDSDISQNVQKSTSVLLGLHSEDLLSSIQGNGVTTCATNASIVKTQLVLNKVGVGTDIQTSQSINNSVSVSALNMVHLGSHINVSPGAAANVALGSLCGNSTLLANTLTSSNSLATSNVDVQNILKANVMANGPTMVSLNPEAGSMLLAANTNQVHSVNAVNGGLQLGATNAMYNLAKIAAEQQPLIVTSHSVSSNGSAVSLTNSMPNSRTQSFVLKSDMNSLQPNITPKHQYIVSSEMKQEKPDEKSAGMATAAVPMSPHTITVVRNINPASTVQTVAPHLQIVSAGNQGKPLMQQQGPMRIQIPQIHQMHMLAPRPGTGAITLPPGVSFPTGSVVMKNEQGHLVIMQGMPRQVLTAAPVSAAQQQQQQQPSPQMISALRPGIMPGQPHLVQATTASGQQVILRQGNVVQATAAQQQQLQQHIMSQQIRIQVPQSAASVVNQLQQSASGNKSQQPVLHQQRSPQDMENVQKCKNFLSTLIKLATQQAPATISNVRNLIQGLIDGAVQPESFTAQLQQELKSSPQPGLVPFLKKSLPLLRDALRKGELQIEGVRAPLNLMAAPASSSATTIMPAGVLQMQVGTKMMQEQMKMQQQVLQPMQQQVLAKRPQPILVSQQLKVAAARGANLLPTPVTQLQLQHQQLQQHQQQLMFQQQLQREPSPSPKKQKLGFQEDDDINDVAAMGGVNLSEESKNILATTNADAIGSQHRSCKDEYFLITSALSARLHAAAAKKGLREIAADVLGLVSHATQERLRHIAEKLSLLAEHRLEVPKADPRCEPSGGEVRTQLKFLEELERLERKRHEDEERERLLRAAKSRSKHEDPEQARLKQKAKELQEAEMEEVRKRDANITALAAIGPRKKRRLDDSPGASHGGGGGSVSSAGGVGSSPASSSAHSSAVSLRPRMKRVNLRDLIFVMEQDREVAKSPTLYRMYLK